MEVMPPHEAKRLLIRTTVLNSVSVVKAFVCACTLL